MSQERCRIVLVGLGNEYRGDDAVGLLAVDRIRAALSEAELNNCINYSKNRGDPADLIALLTDHERVIIIDAARNDLPPGTISRYEPLTEAVTEKATGANLHSFSLIDTIKLAQSLPNSLSHLIIFGITGERFNPSPGLSRSVEKGLVKLTDQVTKQLSDWLAEPHPA